MSAVDPLAAPLDSGSRLATAMQQTQQRAASLNAGVAPEAASIVAGRMMQKAMSGSQGSAQAYPVKSVAYGR